MTIVAEPPTRAGTADAEPATVAADPQERPASDEHDQRSPVRPGALAVSWLLITIVGVALVLISVGPISEERDQRALLGAYRAEIESASNQAYGLAGVEIPTDAPSIGAPVAVVDIERIGLSRVVVEGTGPEQTRQGPGHVVGTGGPGQPGNSVIVGRKALFGGAFADLGALQLDDRILVTTDQGRSVYKVEHVGTHTLIAASTETRTAASSTTTSSPPTTSASDDAADDDTEEGAAPMVAEGSLTVDALYGPSPDDRLTLVTTASGGPAASDEALVVVARMETQPFAPTPQGGRTVGDDGRSGSSGNWAALVLALLAYVTAVIGAIWLHRNVPWRSAYLLTVPVVVALTIVLGDQLAALLPAWT